MSDRAVWALDTPGVRHAAADARALTHVATGGESGLVASGGGGLVVTPGDSTSVRILPCSVVAVSRYPGHVNQSYAFRVPQAVDVPIRAAGSGGSRMDAIILRVRDRSVEGATVPDDPNSVGYWEPVVLEGVPSSTKYTEDGIAAWKNITYPFVLLGLALVPRSSSAISEVSFLANAINARTRRHSPIVHNFAANSLVSNTGTRYENVGPTLYVDVPSWATHCTVVAHVSGMVLQGVSSQGNLNALFMTVAMPEPTKWDMDTAPGGGFTRGSYTVGGDLSIRADRRGTSQPFQLRASNSRTGSFGVGVGSSMVVDVFFEERIDMNWG